MYERRNFYLSLGLWFGLLALGLAGPAGCKKSVPDRAPTLAELQTGDQVKASGQWLMAVPEGLTRLDAAASATNAVIIGVHGYESAGYEWVYPLKKLGQLGGPVYFYRWNYRECPQKAAKLLGRAVQGLGQNHPGIERVRLFAHSLGGIAAGIMAQTYAGEVPIEVNLIASPVSGHPRLTSKCGDSSVKAPADGSNVTLKQWRTQKELDKAFADLDVDPQVADLPGEVVRLPEKYGERRLGHNWSISWVADQVTAAR